MDRITQLTSFLLPTTSFADVGCDHGYCTQYMLRHDLCQTAIIADISAKSLHKAEVLLAEYITQGRVSSVCCDGLQQIPSTVQEVLIAGMGGEEIVKILTDSFIPHAFVFQPMKNADKLRLFLMQNGCRLLKDDVFFADGKYYFVMQGERGQPDPYTADQLLYGKDSLQNPVFYEYIRQELAKKQGYLQSRLSIENRQKIEREIDYLQRILSNECS